METWWAVAYLAGGLIVLVWGGEWLVRGAEQLALSFKVSPLVIGLTVVAFGTSAPELAVTTLAAYRGTDVGVGNVIGSNIFNILAILGLAATIAPLVVSSLLIRRDVPIMVLVSFVIYWRCLDGQFTRWEGIAAFAFLMLYTWWLISASRKEERSAAIEPKPTAGRGQLAKASLLVALGLGLLVLGSHWLVAGAVQIARIFQVSELVIGLTIIAAGTSLPEVITSVVASLRGQRDIAVGNIVGSNIFNLLCVMGLAATVAPQPIPISTPALAFDFPVMLIVAVACLPMFVGGRIARWEGLVFLFYYLAYVTYIVLEQTGSPWHSDFQSAMLYFVMPITVLTIVATLVWRRPPSSASGDDKPPD